MNRQWPDVNCPHCGGSLENAGGWTGDDLRKLREDAELTLRELARRGDISAGYVNHMETGKRPVSLWAPALYRKVIVERVSELRAKATEIEKLLEMKEIPPPLANS